MPPIRGWRWRLSSCRIAPIIRSGRNQVAGFNRAKSIGTERYLRSGSSAFGKAYCASPWGRHRIDKNVTLSTASAFCCDAGQCRLDLLGVNQRVPGLRGSSGDDQERVPTRLKRLRNPSHFLTCPEGQAGFIAVIICSPSACFPMAVPGNTRTDLEWI